MNSGDMKITIPSEIEEQLIKDYNILLKNPKPEEEERIHNELLQIFQKLSVNLPQDSEICVKSEVILELIRSWDPLDYWFVELPELPIKLRNFLISFTKFQAPDNIKKLLSTEAKKLTNLIGQKPEKKETNKEEEIIELESNLDKIESIKGNMSVSFEESNRINKRIEILQEKMKKLQLNAVKKLKTPTITVQNLNGNKKQQIKSKNERLKPPVLKLSPIISSKSEKSKRKITEPKIASKEIKIKVEHQKQNEIQKLITNQEPITNQELNLNQKADTLPENQIQTYNRAEIEQILALEENNPTGSSILTQIFVRKIDSLPHPDIIIKDEFEPKIPAILDKKANNEQDPEILYQELIRFRAKVFYLQLKQQKIIENVQSGNISEARSQLYIKQNKKELAELETKIEKIENSLFSP
ncbi:MAG: hypothetical protein K9W44_13085 [Candidatus Lokiarchaeota archaeon]|nr:hypothetical protein [Candidatus Harpocratesius repetitus]